MTKIPELSVQLQALFTTTANKLVQSTGFIRRQRQITGSGFAQTLVFGGLSMPQATRRQQHQSAIQAGMQVSPQALEQLFAPQARDFTGFYARVVGKWTDTIGVSRGKG